MEHLDGIGESEGRPLAHVQYIHIYIYICICMEMHVHSNTQISRRTIILSLFDRERERERLDTPGDNPMTSHASRSITNQAPTQLNPDRRGTPLTTTTTRQRAEAAAAALANIARQQMANTGECISYGLLEPHVAALMDWIATLPADDIAARVQLPPVLTPLRGGA